VSIAGRSQNFNPRPQAVADPGLGQHIARLRSGSASIFLPQLANYRPADYCAFREGIPQFAEAGICESAPCRHACTRRTQQIVFLRGQLHIALADLDDAPHQVDRKARTDAKHRAARRCACTVELPQF